MSIEIRNLNKRFGKTVVCDNLNLDIPSGELVALLGPSGSGKTSLLRIIAGLERPDSGSVLFHGEDATFDDVRDRHVGFVFQHYALFGHMSIFENVAFGLRVRPRATRPSDAKITAKVTELLKLVQLDWLADRHPHQLSGGQRQRVALARALAVEPKVLLLDEPFGALDAKVRKELRRWLRRLHDEMHVTSVFVTHDQEEAARVLGASGWQIFFRVTLPNVKWALLYGVILCNARAMGEFGAVSVVSGHIRGQTNTMPLHIEILYNEYQFAAAFAVASLLAGLALVTLVLKYVVEQRVKAQKRDASSRNE